MGKNILSVRQNPPELGAKILLAVRENLRSVPEQRQYLGETLLALVRKAFRPRSGVCVCVCAFLFLLACVSETRPLIWRFRLMICLKCAGSSGSSYTSNMPHLLAILYLSPGPLFGDSGSSYILNTPPDLASPVHYHI